MGLFDRFRKKAPEESIQPVAAKVDGSKKPVNTSVALPYADPSGISEDERTYYQPDEHYTLEGVITFEERKKSTRPSARGLYVAEILLLDEVRYGNLPKPDRGYWDRWWFEFGIRDVGHALESLEKRGFIRWAPKSETVKNLKTDELKQILIQAGLPEKGRKAALVERILTEIPEEKLPDQDNLIKYQLTELGETELAENGHIPYVDRHPFAKQREVFKENDFDLWHVDEMVKNNPDLDWRVVVGGFEKQLVGIDIASYVPAGETRIIVPEVNKLEKRDEMRKYLASRKNDITAGILSESEGIEALQKAVIYQYVGEDGEALVQLYIVMGKKDPAVGPYLRTASLLREYGLLKEELRAINSGLRDSYSRAYHRDRLEERKKEVQELLEQEKNQAK